MAKEEGIEMEGVVTEVLPDRNYRVLLDNGHQILAYAAGKPINVVNPAALAARSAGTHG